MAHISTHIFESDAGDTPRPASRSSGFGARLRQHRTAARLSQEQLARLAGVSTRTVSDLERGIHPSARRHTVDALAAALDLPPDDRDEFARLAANGAGPGVSPAPDSKMWVEMWVIFVARAERVQPRCDPGTTEDAPRRRVRGGAPANARGAAVRRTVRGGERAGCGSPHPACRIGPSGRTSPDQLRRARTRYRRAQTSATSSGRSSPRRARTTTSATGSNGVSCSLTITSRAPARSASSGRAAAG